VTPSTSWAGRPPIRKMAGANQDAEAAHQTPD
jgi:hypothetical protein